MLGIGPAIRFDIANIVVAHGDASRAEAWLTRGALVHADLLDTLAATYVEVGKERHAWAMNQLAIDTEVQPLTATLCRRLVRKIVLDPAGNDEVPRKQLLDLATKPKVPDPTCLALHHALECWRSPATTCHDHIASSQVDPAYIVVMDTYYNWPTDERDAMSRVAIAARLHGTLQLPEARELANGAIDAAIRAAGRCDTPTTMTLGGIIRDLKTLGYADVRFDERLADCAREQR